MKHLLLRLFFLLFLFHSQAFSWELATSKKLYHPEEEIVVTFSWQSTGDLPNEATLFATLNLPGGKRLFLLPESFSSGLEPWGDINLLHSGQQEIVSFYYPSDSWLPPGKYEVSAQVFDQNVPISPLISTWFETTSHYIPLTYLNSDPEAGFFRTVAVEDGYWVVFAARPYISGKGWPLYALKLSVNGYTLIPPFFTGFYKFTTNNQEKPSAAGFFLEGLPGGKLALVTTTYDSSRHRYGLVLAIFDSQGRPLRRETILQGSQNFYSPWFYLDDNELILLFRQENTLYSLLAGEKKPLIEDIGRRGFFMAYYDKNLGRLFVLSQKGSGEDELLSLTSDGMEEFRIPLQNLNLEKMFSDSILKKADKYCIFLPRHSSSSSLFCFDASGQTEITVISGLSVSPYGQGAFDFSIHGDRAEVIWRAGSNYFEYARFNPESGELLLGPERIARLEGTFGRPRIFGGSEKSLVLLGADSRLYALFLGYDLRRGADLVLAAPEVVQSPGPLASLGADTSLNLCVTNRGEKPSSQASLHLSYLGETFSQDVPSLGPGERACLEFVLQQPEFLTTYPVYQAQLVVEDENEINNAIEGQIVFPPNTPIYPPESSFYTWQVLDAVTGEPIPATHLRYELPPLPTVSGQETSLEMTLRADPMGHLKMVLPPGRYRFLLYHSGYPKKLVEVEVPGSQTQLYLEPPGALRLSFAEEGGSPLHPAPQEVWVRLIHLEDPSLPDWQDYVYEARGSEPELELTELMPGDYRLTVKAFGYQEQEDTIHVAGGQELSQRINLQPLPRTSVTGRVVSGGRGISAATVRVIGGPYQATTDGDGYFVLEDFPINPEETYRLEVSKAGYQSRLQSFQVSSENTDLGEISLREIYRSRLNLASCRYAAWVQDAEWSVGDSYAIKTIYGVWDMQGALHYQQLEGSETIDIAQFELQITPLRWDYWDLDSDLPLALINWYSGALGEYYQYFKHFSQLWEAYDWGETPSSVFVAYNDLSDPLGTVHGGVVDCGELDVLDNLPPPDERDPAGTTLIRVDDLQIYDGNTLLFRLRDLGPIQYFPSEYPDGKVIIPVSLTQNVSSKENLHIYLYIFVENGAYQTAPLDLYGVNRLRLEWGVEGNDLIFKGILPDPPEYPGIEE